MQKELVELLAAYLSGWRSLRDCDQWLAGIDWDDPALDAERRRVIGGLELLATEALEGLRPEAEFRQEAAMIVARLKETIPFAFYETAPSAAVSTMAAADTIKSQSEVSGPVEDLRLPLVRV